MTPPAASPGDPYRALASVYDDWQDRYGCFHLCVKERLDEAFGHASAGVGSFVDLGCGTGALLLALGAEHPAWRLSGVDASAEMLARARAKAGAERVRWHHLPLTAPIPNGPHDAAGAFFNTINHLDGDGELRSVCRAVSAALRPGGLFAFDVNNPEGFAAWWSGTQSYEGAIDGVSWRFDVASTYDHQTGVARATLTVELRGSGAPTISATELSERLFTEAQIVAALERADLEPIASARWSPHGDGVSGSTFWTARRRSSGGLPARSCEGG